ncbi:collagen alpha-2(I) chain-like [Pseudopipra pipra]|uniref:collagen alpha-2(I) chain-like n=1 Tax=Pseudopipra pipra TaxID=415032 RepID=UPI0031391EE9
MKTAAGTVRSSGTSAFRDYSGAWGLPCGQNPVRPCPGARGGRAGTHRRTVSCPRPGTGGGQRNRIITARPATRQHRAGEEGRGEAAGGDSPVGRAKNNPSSGMVHRLPHRPGASLSVGPYRPGGRAAGCGPAARRGRTGPGATSAALGRGPVGAGAAHAPRRVTCAGRPRGPAGSPAGSPALARPPRPSRGRTVPRGAGRRQGTVFRPETRASPSELWAPSTCATGDGRTAPPPHPQLRFPRGLCSAARGCLLARRGQEPSAKKPTNKHPEIAHFKSRGRVSRRGPGFLPFLLFLLSSFPLTP